MRNVLWFKLIDILKTILLLYWGQFIESVSRILFLSFITSSRERDVQDVQDILLEDKRFRILYNNKIVYGVIVRRDRHRIIKREELRDECGGDKMKCGGSWRAMWKYRSDCWMSICVSPLDVTFMITGVKQYSRFVSFYCYTRPPPLTPLYCQLRFTNKSNNFAGPKGYLPQNFTSIILHIAIALLLWRYFRCLDQN